MVCTLTAGSVPRVTSSRCMWARPPPAWGACKGYRRAVSTLGHITPARQPLSHAVSPAGCEEASCHVRRGPVGTTWLGPQGGRWALSQHPAGTPLLRPQGGDCTGSLPEQRRAVLLGLLGTQQPQPALGGLGAGTPARKHSVGRV